MTAGADDQLTGLIEGELRTACGALVDAGADTDEVTVDLMRRIRRLRLLGSGPDPAPDQRAPA